MVMELGTASQASSNLDTENCYLMWRVRLVAASPPRRPPLAAQSNCLPPPLEVSFTVSGSSASVCSVTTALGVHRRINPALDEDYRGEFDLG